MFECQWGKYFKCTVFLSAEIVRLHRFLLSEEQREL